jgi:hypothetical protein
MTDIFIKMIKSKNKVMSSLPSSQSGVMGRDEGRKSVETQSRYNINKIQNYDTKLKTKDHSQGHPSGGQTTKNVVKGLHNIPIRGHANMDKNKENSLPPQHSTAQTNQLNRKSTKDLNENISKLKSNPIKHHSINNIRSSFAK